MAGQKNARSNRRALGGRGLLILWRESPGYLHVTILPDDYGHIVILGNLINEPFPVSLAVAWHSLQ